MFGQFDKIILLFFNVVLMNYKHTLSSKIHMVTERRSAYIEDKAKSPNLKEIGSIVYVFF